MTSDRAERPDMAPTSWEKYPQTTLRALVISPLSNSSSPMMRRKMLVLPAPLGPTRPLRLPGRI